MNTHDINYFKEVYEAASANDAYQLNDLLEREVESRNFEDSLERVCMELQLNCVHLEDETKLILDRKLLNLRFSNEQTQKMGLEPKEILGRILFTKQLILNLSECEQNDESFIIILTFIAKQIFTLKRLLKSTYNRVPWEELEFCVLSYIKTFKELNEYVIFSRAILSKQTIVSYLQSLANILEELQTNESMVSTSTKTQYFNRDKIVKEIIEKYPEFKPLYTDYECLRDIHSLNSILNYVYLVDKIELNEKHDKLVLIRAFQIIGEHLKNTLESPKLSQNTINFLTLSLCESSRQIIITIRNELSHNHSPTKKVNLLESLEPDILTGIKNDIGKIGEKIEYILFKSKIEIVRELGYKFLNTDDKEVVKEVASIMKNVRFDFDSSTKKLSKSENKDVSRLKGLISRLRDKTTQELASIGNLLDQIEDILEEHDTAGDFLESFCYMYQSFGMSLESSDSQLEQIHHSMKNIMKRTLNTLPSHIEVSKLESIIPLLFSEPISLHSDPQLTNILYEICFILKLEINRVTWAEKFKRKLEVMDHKKKDHRIDGENEEIKSQILTEMKRIFTNKTYTEYKDDKRLQAVTEVLLLDLIPMLKTSKFMSNLYFFDNDYPSLMGADLRNHLAHNNVMIEVLMDSVAATFLFVENLLQVEEGSGDSPLKDVAFHDLSHIKQSYDVCINHSNKKQKMFTALKDNDFEMFMQCIHAGADIRSRDIDMSTCLHFTMTKPDENLRLTEFLWKKGLSSRYKNLGGQSVLHIAAAKGNLEVVEFLLEKFNSEIGDVDSFERTAAHIASFKGHELVVNSLIDHGADMTKIDRLNRSTLYCAVVSGKINAVEVFFERNLFHKLDRMGHVTSLHLAATYGLKNMLEFLLSKDVEVNARVDTGETPLLLAATSGHLEIVKVLIRSDADVNFCNFVGHSPLHAACKMDGEKLVELLLDNGADIDMAEFQDGLTPMHYAARTGNVNIVNILLANNADANLPTKSGLTPFAIAVESRHRKMVDLLLRQEGTKVNSSDLNSWTPLHHAAFNGDTEITEVLLKSGANVNLKEKEGANPLHLASLNGHENTVKLLITRNVSLEDRTKKHGSLPLHLAAESGNENLIKYLIYEGSNINATTFDGFNCLHIAAQNKKNIVDLLLREGIDINMKTKDLGFTPLHLAIVMNNSDMVRSLLKAGCDINAQNYLGYTPIMIAIQTDPEIVEILVKNVADITIDNKRGSSPLDFAVDVGKMKIVDMLISTGLIGNEVILKSMRKVSVLSDARMLKYLLNLNSKLNLSLYHDETGNTLLHLATLSGEADTIELLLKHGIAINSKDNFGTTPLYLAALRGCEDIVEMLLIEGADINAQNDQGWTPLHIASYKNYPKVVEILLNLGADVYKLNDKNISAVELATGSINVIKHFLRTNKNLLEHKTRYRSSTLLHIATLHGHARMVKFLLYEGANMHAEDESGSKPIHIAASLGFTDIIDIFLERGMDNNSILHYAASTGKADVVMNNNKGQTPLHLSFNLGLEEVVAFLLNNGAILNSTQDHKTLGTNEKVNAVLTPLGNLFSSVETGDIDQIETLIREGVPLNCVDINRGSLLNIAVCKGNVDVVRILLRNNVSTNSAHKNGWTPLHHAVKYSYTEIVILLLWHGARFDVELENGKKPIDFAKNVSIRKLLRLINHCFECIQRKDTTIIDRLDKITCEDQMKAIMRAQNKGGANLITAALKNKFPQTEKLERIFQKESEVQLKRVQTLLDQGKYQEAKELLLLLNEETRNILGDENPGTLSIQSIIGDVLFIQGFFEESLSVHEEIYEKLRKILGSDNERSLKERIRIFRIKYEQDEIEECSKIIEDVHRLQEEILPYNHRDLLYTRSYMALILMKKDKLQSALKILKSILEIQQIYFDPRDPDILETEENIALIISLQGHYDDAIRLFREIHEETRELLGSYHPVTLRTSNKIIHVYLDHKKYYEASEAIEELLNDQRKHLGPLHFETLFTQMQMATLQCKQYRYISAFKLFKEIRGPHMAILGPTHPRVLSIMTMMTGIEDQCKVIGICSNLNSFVEDMVSAMNDAAKRGDIDTIKKQTRSGMGVGEKDEDGKNSLHFAVDGNSVEVIKYLLEHGGDITETTNKGVTSLHIACSKGYMEIVELILNAVGGNKLSCLINAATEIDRTTALHLAAKQGYHEIVRLLLKKGAVFNCVDKDGKRPIDLTEDENVKKILKLVEDLFLALRNEDQSIFSKLGTCEKDEFLCVTNARDSRNLTLLLHFISCKDEISARRLTEMMKTNCDITNV